AYERVIEVLDHAKAAKDQLPKTDSPIDDMPEGVFENLVERSRNARREIKKAATLVPLFFVRTRSRRLRVEGS
ncbi:MAG: hypothetical protein ACR2RE_01695, partial [Geminicoccaceae bacterium]